MRLLLVLLLGLSFSSPSALGASKDSLIMKETYRNNYGIIVSKQEWVRRGRDGTVTKVLKDGSVIHEVYSSGAYHGEVTVTFPHSETVAQIKTYDMGRLLSIKTFFVNGLPAREEVFKEDGSHVTSLWSEGNEADTITTPYFIETVSGGKIVEGFYSSKNGKYTSSISQGTGIRSSFSNDNALLTEEVFRDGELIKCITFYSNRDPESIVHYVNGCPHGLRLTYLIGGIPNTIEEWRYGYQDGMTTVFKNGCKVAEISYVKGCKEGLELRYNESEAIAEEVSWKNNNLHGVRKIYAGDVSKKEWYHHGKVVTKAKFERLNNLAG
ncbi:toxin-antitoxin system YwqK family antitoxin [Chlamydiifrater volucris]|uniref:toxin-antitoxin system YwqK family antitoxin n=1 Tax=Chlamydiifrater volucris TaxID=2681470 RepID=UPI001BCA8AE7|nr:toxin-antitoxin system YwqK family antitoxin [Chlamydiifrater volucris]